jgi:hypothetical protein
MADAQDLKFHFLRFRGAASRFNKSGKTIDFIGWNAVSKAAARRFIGKGILSQLLSQSVAGSIGGQAWTARRFCKPKPISQRFQ